MKKSEDYLRGYLDGLKEASWQCGDCGNVYDNTIEHCPNLLLDQAFVNLRGVGK